MAENDNTKREEKNSGISSEELSLDSPSYNRLKLEISELLAEYEEEFYPDKPQEIVEIEREVFSSPLGKFALSPAKQKIYNDFMERRMQKDEVFFIDYYLEQYLENITYFRTFLARQYEKIYLQGSSEELMKKVLEKKSTGNGSQGGQGSQDVTSDPYLQLLTRTNALKEFIDDYIGHMQHMRNISRVCLEFFHRQAEEGNRPSSPLARKLLEAYERLYQFYNRLYHQSDAQKSEIDTNEIVEEIAKNREFLQNNQTALNKLVKPQYVVLEHSKIVNLTKKIMESSESQSIRVDAKGTTIETSITTDEEFRGVRIDSFDTLVEEAIGSLLDINQKTFQENGYIDVPLSAIAQQVLILNPNAHISKEQGSTIAESMDKLRHIFVKVDFRAQALAHKKLKLDEKEASIEDNALNYTKTTVNWKGNTIEVYRIHSYPPRYQYSKAVKQISGVSRNYLYLPNMNITKGVAILRRYLVEYIEGIKSSNLSKTIFFETINANCEGCFAYESKEAKRDFRKKVTTMLEGFKHNGYIADYSVVSEGRILKGVNIIPEA